MILKHLAFPEISRLVHCIERKGGRRKYHDHFLFDKQVVKEVDYTALLIKEAFPEDAGSYTVLIRNPLGEARSFTQLIVEEFFCRTP